MLLLASCGQQHDAEKLVESFMQENLKDAATLSEVRFAPIDSTRYISDSIVNVMRQNARQPESPYKTDAAYTGRGKGSVLFSARANYKLNGKPYVSVFYLDKALSGVVAFNFAEE